MIHPYKKHDAMLGRDLTNAERLEPAVHTLEHARRLLEQFSRDVQRASDRLNDEQLETICRAAYVAMQAAENAAFLGNSHFNPRPLETVKWEEAPSR